MKKEINFKSKNLFDNSKLEYVENPSIQRVGITLEQYNEYLNLKDKVKLKDEYNKLIIDIGFDYDGYRKAEDLMAIIDELVNLARKSLNNNQDIYGELEE